MAHGERNSSLNAATGNKQQRKAGAGFLVMNADRTIFMNLFFLCALNPGPQINKILDMAPDPDHHSRAVEIMAAKEEAINLEDQS
mgnify:CR=1 FL=1